MKLTIGVQEQQNSAILLSIYKALSEQRTIYDITETQHEELHIYYK